MIKVTNVTKHFGDFKVLNDISLNVPKGSIYGLVGPNGAGKTTIINHINGVLKPESGTITVNGEPVFDNSKLKETILNISDDWFYYSTFTVKQMADFYRDLYPRFNDARYEVLKNVFKIDDKKQLRKFSKGMKKQVAFWLSLCAMPDLLILDEPLDGLDPVMRKQVLNLVISDVAERGLTVLVSSHNLRELEDICDYVGIIHKGEMILEKPLHQLLGSVYKYQLAFKGDVLDELKKTEGILSISKTGSVYSVIVKSEFEDTEEKLKALSPVLMEKISLTLEEIFIYELGGLGYDFTNIIL